MFFQKTLIYLLPLLKFLEVVLSHGIVDNKTISANRMFAVFDPYVSILDKGNPYRYSINELLQLVDLAATRFSRLLVVLKSEDLSYNNRTGASLSPLAVAHYNSQLHVTAKTKLEMWIAYRNEKNGNTASFELTLNNLLLLSNEANQISQNTVTTIMLTKDVVHLLNLTHFMGDLRGKCNHDYELIILSEPLYCRNISWNYGNTIQTPYEVHGTFMQFNENFSESRNLAQACPKCKLLSDCLKEENNGSGFILSIPDTFQGKTASMSQQVSVWKQLQQRSITTGTTIIFSKAFDTPYEKNVEAKTSGWWRLMENPDYKSVKDYKFVEKRVEAKEFDLQQNKINFQELEVNPNFSREHVGVIFSLSGMKSYIKNPYSDNELTHLMPELARQFSKMLILVDFGVDKAFGETILSELHAASETFPKVHGMLMFTKRYNRSTYSSWTVTELAENYGFHPDLLKTVVIPHIVNNSAAVTDHMNIIKDMLVDKPRSSYSIGYAFDVSLCISFEMNSQEEKRLIKERLQDNDINVVAFTFEEDRETVKLGVERMFQQRIVELEQCKRFLMDRGVRDELEVIFVMLHYATEPDFYNDPWEMQRYVKYWEKITAWAGNTNTTVIMNNAIDGARYMDTRNESGHLLPDVEIGWWRQQESENLTKFWVDKRVDTIQTAKRHFAKKDKSLSGSLLSSKEIILIALILVLICSLMIILAVFLIRNYRRRHITNNDVIHFLYGNNEECSVYYRIPYDQNQFEIDPGFFRLEKGGCLGKGQFGIVSKGQLVQATGTKSVAIKRPNPLNMCKTTILGLLTEIKVLSLVGKHPNIVELLGANTSDLKHGKVFIFLEFCHNGSLETHLKKLREQIADDVTHSVQCAIDGLQEVQNNSESLQRILPKFYRWSREICDGMVHLATNQIVHADLATRNVLLTLDEQAKICDFGLSKRLTNGNSYVTQLGPMPWKWMAPEALRSSTFNEKTDVWAYGVTLWEIYSLGDQPYDGILSFDANFIQTLQLGFQLATPQFCCQSVYQIMQKCWVLRPDLRPNFAILREDFDNE